MSLNRTKRNGLRRFLRESEGRGGIGEIGALLARLFALHLELRVIRVKCCYLRCKSRVLRSQNFILRLQISRLAQRNIALRRDQVDVCAQDVGKLRVAERAENGAEPVGNHAAQHSAGTKEGQA